MTFFRVLGGVLGSLLVYFSFSFVLYKILIYLKICKPGGTLPKTVTRGIRLLLLLFPVVVVSYLFSMINVMARLLLTYNNSIEETITKSLPSTYGVFLFTFILLYGWLVGAAHDLGWLHFEGKKPKKKEKGKNGSL
jgi:hypothetical protein